MKLDRSFIQTLVHSEQDKAIVKAILDLARCFVSPSPPKEWRKRSSSPCSRPWDASIIKGFLTSRPLPVKALESLLGATLRAKLVGFIGLSVIK